MGQIKNIKLHIVTDIKNVITELIDVMFPLVGLGTFKLRNNNEEELVYHVLHTALAVGYRLIDTAACYRNEKDIGEALNKLYNILNISRSDVFITSKVAPKDLNYEATIASCMKSISDLQCTYLDCCLIHWPGKAKLKPDNSQHPGFRKEAWRALEDLKNQGLIRNIGVSNFTVRHLDELLKYAKVKPVVNQVEFHVHLQQKELLQFCIDNGIFLQSYSTLGTGLLITDETVIEVSKRYERSPAQILLKWALQQGVGVIPKSTNDEHIKKNFQLDDFNIDDDDMITLSRLNIDKHYCWDPSLIC